MRKTVFGEAEVRAVGDKRRADWRWMGDTMRGDMLSRSWNALRMSLGRPVDGGSLAAARIVVGLVVALTAIDLIWPQGRTTQLHDLYTSEGINWHATYSGFRWVPVFDEPVMEAVCWGMVISGLLVALGCFYRPAVIVAFLLRTYLFLADATYFNNHYYLECLLLVVLCCAPAAKRYSVDGWWRRRGGVDDGLVPFWPIFLLRGQLFLVYFFGGVTKLTEFYLLHAFPLRTALLDPKLASSMGWVLSEEQLLSLRGWLARSEVAFGLSYAGLAFDLTVGFLLLYRPTRWVGIALTVAFHMLNHFVLFNDIRWFPMLGIGTVAIFLDPDWPARAWARLRGDTTVRSKKPKSRKEATWSPLSSLTTALICSWFVWQILMPLRHLAIAGDVNWTDEGGWFSWRMKAHHKLTRPTVFRVEDDAMQEVTEEGQRAIVWDEWPNARMMLQDVDVARVNWRSLPAIFVEFVPFYGERILFNPYGGGQREPLEVDQSVQLIQAYWQKHYGRTIDVGNLHATESLVKVLEFWQSYLIQEQAGPKAIAAAEQSRRNAVEIEQRRHDALILPMAVESLHRSLLEQMQAPEYKGQIRNLLSRVSPFALAGVEAPAARFIVIEDPALQRPSDSNFMAIDRDAWVEAYPEASYVYLDVDQLTGWEWGALSEFVAVRTLAGDEQIRWNPHQGVNAFQEQFMRVHPQLLHDYVQHIADQWQARFGRRPRVYIDSLVSLLPWPMQPLIDPEVDLAAVGRSSWRHNEWILPMQKSPEQRIEAGRTSSLPQATPASEAR